MTENGKDIRPPHQLDVHVEELTRSVDAITATARESVRAMQERMEAVLKAISEKAASLSRDIADYEALARELTDVSKIAGEPFEALAAKIKVQAPPIRKVDVFAARDIVEDKMRLARIPAGSPFPES
jgi:phage host-nuclease inhibitor protein Gam